VNFPVEILCVVEIDVVLGEVAEVLLEEDFVVVLEVVESVPYEIL